MSTESASNDATPSTRLTECATVVSAFFTDVFAQLHDWQGRVEAVGGRLHGAELDAAVAAFAIPALERPDSPLIGAGFIGDAKDHSGKSLHFAWWIGPIEANPLLSETNESTKLDITARGYADYVSDFAVLEWYRIPQSTRQAHVTGPYVDHLCTCDYILTITAPVLINNASKGSGEMFGVVGADVFVRSFERAIMPSLLAIPADAAVLNESGRVVVSTDTKLAVGAVLTEKDQERDWLTVACAGAPFSVVMRKSDTPE
ncbi:MAG: cache domain-containing protein [Terrimesophilobacter sp.]